MSTTTAKTVLSSHFNFGWCNACERYALGYTIEAIVDSPNVDSTAQTEREISAVTAGVHAATGIICGAVYVDEAQEIARRYGISETTLAEMVQLALDA